MGLLRTVLPREIEVGVVRSSVRQSHIQHPAGATPCFVCFPDIDVLVGRRVVVETAVTRIDRGLDIINRLMVVTCHRSGQRKTSGENVQPLIATQTELDRDRAARLNPVEHRNIIHGREEAVPTVAYVSGVASQVASLPTASRDVQRHRCSSRPSCVLAAGVCVLVTPPQLSVAATSPVKSGTSVDAGEQAAVIALSAHSVSLAPWCHGPRCSAWPRRIAIPVIKCPVNHRGPLRRARKRIAGRPGDRPRAVVRRGRSRANGRRALAVTSANTGVAGAIVSCTTMFCVAVVVLPFPSLNVQ